MLAWLAMKLEFDPADLARFRDRRWDLVRAGKERHWAEQTRIQGPIAGLEASTGLWLLARSVDPTWPTPELRRLDLDHHAGLAAKIRRLEHVFAHR